MQLPDALVQTFDCNGNIFQSYYRGGGSQSNLAIDTDGTVFFPINLFSATQTLPCTNSPGSGTFTSTFALFQLKPDGSTSVTPIRTVSGDSQSTTKPNIDAWQVIPDGQGGTLVAWVDRTTPNQPLDYVTHLSASGNSDFYFPSLHGPIASMVLGENGAAYATDSQTIQAFNVNSGALWSYTSQALDGIAIIASSAGGGLVAQEFPTNDTATVSQFDSNGNPSLLTTAPVTTAPYTGQLYYSWTADWNVPIASAPLASISAPIFDLANVVWTAPLGNPSGTSSATKPIASQVRVQIGATALGFVGSQNWLDDPNPSNPAPNHCNIFVHDVLKQVGLTPPDSDLSSKKRQRAYLVGLVDSPFYPARAGDWANPGKILKGWKTVLVPVGAPAGSFSSDFSLPGDILAEAIQYSDASGHVGIIVNNLQHQTASADSTTSCDFSGLPAGVITITDYGFRPDNYLRICHMQSGDIQLTHGQKRYAVVKRFFGQ